MIFSDLFTFLHFAHPYLINLSFHPVQLHVQLSGLLQRIANLLGQPLQILQIFLLVLQGLVGGPVGLDVAETGTDVA